MRKTALEGSMKNVADGLREEGRWQEAEEMHGKALEGPWARHGQTMSPRSNMIERALHPKKRSKHAQTLLAMMMLTVGPSFFT